MDLPDDLESRIPPAASSPTMELDAAKTCIGALGDITADAQFRVWFWLGQRLGLLPPPMIGRPLPFPTQVGPNAPGSGQDGDPFSPIRRFTERALGDDS